MRLRDYENKPLDDEKDDGLRKKIVSRLAMFGLVAILLFDDNRYVAKTLQEGLFIFQDAYYSGEYDEDGLAPAEDHSSQEVVDDYEKIAEAAELLQGATVALVNNSGWDQQKFEDFARECEIYTYDTTDGIINIKITPIQPTKSAQEAAEKITNTGVMLWQEAGKNSLRPNEFASYQAAKEMSSLCDYDKVISLNSPDLKPALWSEAARNTIMGTAAAEKGTIASYRYADLYLAMDEYDYQANLFTKIFLHELLHLYGLGHEGSIMPDGKTSFYWNDRNWVLDLDEILQGDKTTYLEYDGITPMGNRWMVSSSDLALDDIQKSLLSNAARVLGWESIVRQENISSDNNFL